MKKILIPCLLLISTFAFSQQPGKGSIMIGGDLSFNAQKRVFKDDITGTTSETNLLSFGLSPRGGYTLFDGFMVGAIISVGAGRSSFGVNKNTTSLVQAGPFVRYYLPFGLFGEVNFTGGVVSNKSTSSGVGTSTTDKATSGFLGAGFAYFLNSNVSLEPIIGFGFDRFKLDNNDITTTRGLRFRVSLVFYLRNE